MQVTKLISARTRTHSQTKLILLSLSYTASDPGHGVHSCLKGANLEAGKRAMRSWDKRPGERY